MTKKADRQMNTSCEACFGKDYVPGLSTHFIVCNNPRSDHYGHVLEARHSCSEFGITQPPDADWFDNPELDNPRKRLWFEQLDKVEGKLSERIVNALYRGYMSGRLYLPLEEVSDYDLLRIPYFGVASLRAFRRLFPVELKGEENVEEQG